jgi:hypothetical protein
MGAVSCSPTAGSSNGCRHRRPHCSIERTARSSHLSSALSCPNTADCAEINRPSRSPRRPDHIHVYCDSCRRRHLFLLRRREDRLSPRRRVQQQLPTPTPDDDPSGTASPSTLLSPSGNRVVRRLAHHLSPRPQRVGIVVCDRKTIRRRRPRALALPASSSSLMRGLARPSERAARTRRARPCAAVTATAWLRLISSATRPRQGPRTLARLYGLSSARQGGDPPLQHAAQARPAWAARGAAARLCSSRHGLARPVQLVARWRPPALRGCSPTLRDTGSPDLGSGAAWPRQRHGGSPATAARGAV